MKKLIFLLSGFCWFSVANAQLSCDDLDDLAASLDDLAEAIQYVEEIGVNTELDGALGELTNALSSVAYVEQDQYLSGQISGLKSSWDNLDRYNFEESLDNIIERLDGLGERDCEGW